MKPVLQEYQDLLSYDATVPMSRALKIGRTCSTSAIYVHYLRATALDLSVSPFWLDCAADRVRDQCLQASYRIRGDGAEWICAYVGQAAAFVTGRTAADRFRHEFGLAGYFQQAPVLEAICALVHRSQHWTPISKGAQGRVYLPAEQRLSFLRWCTENVRCAFHGVPLVGDDAKRKLRTDERALISELKPLLNHAFSENPFTPYLKRARREFRSGAVRQEATERRDRKVEGRTDLVGTFEMGAATLERRPSTHKFNQLRPFGLWLAIA